MRRTSIKAENVRYQHARDLSKANGQPSWMALDVTTIVEPEQTLVVGSVTWVRLNVAGALYWVTNDLPDSAAPGESTVSEDDADDAIERSVKHPVQ
jgi:hypothetical protein